MSLFILFFSFTVKVTSLTRICGTLPDMTLFCFFSCPHRRNCRKCKTTLSVSTLFLVDRFFPASQGIKNLSRSVFYSFQKEKRKKRQTDCLRDIEHISWFGRTASPRRNLGLESRLIRFQSGGQSQAWLCTLRWIRCRSRLNVTSFFLRLGAFDKELPSSYYTGLAM